MAAWIGEMTLFNNQTAQALIDRLNYENQLRAQRDNYINALSQLRGNIDERTSIYIEKARLARENQRLKEKVKELEKIINHLKEGDSMRSDYFRLNGRCIRHDDYDCDDCNDMVQEEDEQEREEKREKTTAIVVSSLSTGNQGSIEVENAQVKMKSELSRQKRFIKKSLGLTDEKIKKTKVNDLPNLLKKAQSEITVGGMEELLEEDTKDSGGFIKGLLRFFLKMGK